MKKILYFGLVVLILPLLCLSILPTQKISYAETTPEIQIEAPEKIAIGDFPDSLQFTATLSSVDNFTPDQIVWTINNSTMNTLTVLGNSSVLTVYKNYYKDITAKTTWLIVAKINNDIMASKTLVFDFTEIKQVDLLIIGPQIQEASNTLVPLTLEAVLTGNPATKTYEWFQKTYANKYSKLNTTSSTYTFTPQLPGIYTFKVCVNGVFSTEKHITVNFKPVNEIIIKCNQATNNANNLNRFVFTAENLNEYNDLDKLNWYIQEYGLVQQGGKTFDFQTTQYGTFRVYAVYEDEVNNISVKSDQYPLEIAIDRTKEILIVCGIIVGVMTVFLVIGSIRMVKRDKIW